MILFVVSHNTDSVLPSGVYIYTHFGERIMCLIVSKTFLHFFLGGGLGGASTSRPLSEGKFSL